MNLLEYGQYREGKQHTEPQFAYSTYLCTIPLDFLRVPLHWHEEMELIYIKKGSGVITVQLQPYPVVAGSIVIVRPGQLHAIEGDAGVRMEYENIIFPLALLEGANADWCNTACIYPIFRGEIAIPVHLLSGTSLHKKVAECLDHADAACSEGLAGCPMLVKGELYRMFYHLYMAAGTPISQATTVVAERLKTVLAYVEEHYAEKISVERVATVACYSEAHFMRFFKTNMNQTFVAYLLDYRLEVAAQRLAQTNDALLLLSAQCGFENLSYFSRCFKEKYGVPPGQYRRKHRGL